MPRVRANGDGAVYKRPDGRWTARLMLPDGKRRDFYGPTRAQVVGKLKAAQEASSEVREAPVATQTAEAYFDDWLAGATDSVRPRTLDSYRLNVNRMREFIADKHIDELSPATIQHVYSTLLSRGLSRRSVEQMHAVLHLALKLAVRQGLLLSNPTEAVSVPRPARAEMKTLTAAELQKLCKTSSTSRWGPLWVVLGTTGIRLGEALGLHWSDIDLPSKRLVVRRALQLQSGGRGYVLVEPKTARARRTVLLSEYTTQVLARYRDSDESQHAAVFVRPDGRYIEAARVREALRAATRAAGLPDIRVHDLRHTVATLLFEHGASVKQVQELLGHSTSVLTLDTYAHATPVMHERTAAAFDLMLAEER